MDAARHMPRTTGSHTPLLPNHSDYYNHSAPLIMPPYYYVQYPHHQIMNNLTIIPLYYYDPPLYVRASSVQRPLPPEDPELYPKIVKQIEYYFSQENLVTDTYLKNKMDRYGWVDVSVIAEFRRIKALTDDKHHILEALVSSSAVQVRGYKMRVRYGWKKWIDQSKFEHATHSNNIVIV